MKEKSIVLCSVFFIGFFCGYVVWGVHSKRLSVDTQSESLSESAAPLPELIKTSPEPEPSQDPAPFVETVAAVRSIPEPPLANGLHRYPIEKVLRVVDGDTMDVRFYSWEDIILVKRLRLLGVNTPELHPRKGTAEEKAMEKQAALAALAFVQQAVDKAQALYLVTDWKSDSFGRVLAVVEYRDNSGMHNLCDDLLKYGHAKPYDK